MTKIRGRGRFGEDEFRRLFHAVPVPTYTWRRRDEDFVLESYNDAAEIASHRQAASYVGRTARDIYADEPEIIADFERAARTAKPFSREFWYSVPDSHEQYALEVTYAPLSDDTLVVHTVSHTEQRLVESELRLRLDELRAADAARRKLLDDLARAQERERERIAEEIRDDAIEPLVAVALRLQTVQRTAGEEVADKVAKLQTDVSDAIARLRHLTFTLHPESLPGTTLAASLRDLIEHMTGRATVRASFDNRLTREPDAGARIGAYRMTQQAIANALRHAEAGRIDVVAEERDGNLAVVVADDGRGFDAGSVTAVPDGGLALMRRRAELAGGHVGVRSEPGRGTTVEIVLPTTWPATW
jgi:signal transduction histidine kinase